MDHYLTCNLVFSGGAKLEVDVKISVPGLDVVAVAITSKLSEILFLSKSIHAQGEKIMTALEALQQFATAQEQFNTTQGTAIDKIVTAQGGLAGDIQNLTQQISVLTQNAQVPPEVQARIDALTQSGAALNTKAQAVADALLAVDALTPPVPPTP